MRALLFDGYHQEIKEIILPDEAILFYQQVRQLLNTEAVDMIHPNQKLTILFDPLAFGQAGMPAFLLEVMKEFPLFGNAICVGRNLRTYQIEDLPEEFTRDHFEVNWYDPAASEEVRIKSMKIGIDNYRS